MACSITLSGDVNSACFNDAGILGGMTSPTQAKQMTFPPIHAGTVAGRGSSWTERKLPVGHLCALQR